MTSIKWDIFDRAMWVVHDRVRREIPSGRISSAVWIAAMTFPPPAATSWAAMEPLGSTGFDPSLTRLFPSIEQLLAETSRKWTIGSRKSRDGSPGNGTN